MSIEVDYIPSEYYCVFLFPTYPETSIFSKIQAWEWKPSNLTAAVEEIEERRVVV